MSEEAKAEEVQEQAPAQEVAPKEEVQEEKPAVREEVVDLTDESVEYVTDDFLEQELEKAILAEQQPDEEPAPEPIPQEPTATESTVGGEVVAEAPEEPQLPEFMEKFEGEADLSDPDLIDAINFWGGGPREDWTRQNVADMPEDKQEKFKAVQRAYDRYKDAPKTSAEQYQFTKEEAARAQEQLAKLLMGDEETINDIKGSIIPKDRKADSAPEPTKQELVKQELREKLKEAMGEGDTELFDKTFQDILSDVVTKTAERVKAEASQDALSRFEEQQREQMIASQRQKWESEAATLAQSEGTAFTQYIENNAIQDLLGIGYDPITRTQVKTVQDAYNICRNAVVGGKPIVPRPSIETRTSQPATEVSEPSLQDLQKEMDNYSLDDYLQAVADKTYLKPI